MPQKGRIPVDDKIKAVENYLSGNEGYINSCQKYGIGKETLRRWVRLYKMRGVEWLTPSAQCRKYPVEIKKSAIQDYLSGVGSISDICVKYDISDDKILRRWIKWYNDHGDFKQPNSGGVIYVAAGFSTQRHLSVKSV